VPEIGPPAATSPAPTPAPAPVADIAVLLRDSAAITDLDGAYSRLFALWSARYVPGSEDACSQSLRQGLECLNQRGDIELLRAFNRPAILPLVDAGGAVHQTVVTQLRGSQAELLIGAVAHEVSIADLQQHWSGDFQLLWKPQQLDTRSLTMGMRGEPVRHLQARLREWAGVTAPATDTDFFDATVERLVQQFQRQHGLQPDGVAGPQTQAMLDAVLAQAGTPQLYAGAPGN
jgi:general secretion pathway protein A